MIVLAALLVALPFGLRAQEPAAACGGAARGACTVEADEDAWERLSRELNSYSADAVLQSGRGADPPLPQPARSGQDVTRSESTAAAADRSVDPARQAKMPRYRATLAALRSAGLGWAEACPLAAADAFGTDWLTESRRCVEARTGARTFARFEHVLTRHGASRSEACVAAEVWWNGLSVGRARELCDERHLDGS